MWQRCGRWQVPGSNQRQRPCGSSGIPHRPVFRPAGHTGAARVRVSERDLPTGQVAGVLQPYAGALRAKDDTADTYTLDGTDAPFLVFCHSPRLYRERDTPSAVGAMRSRKLCHWDLHAGVSPQDAGREIRLKVGNAALALASRSGGVALDVLGFSISSADDLLPRLRGVRVRWDGA
jgi:hypothetical protein